MEESTNFPFWYTSSTKDLELDSVGLLDMEEKTGTVSSLLYNALALHPKASHPLRGTVGHYKSYTIMSFCGCSFNTKEKKSTTVNTNLSYIELGGATRLTPLIQNYLSDDLFLILPVNNTSGNNITTNHRLMMSLASL